MYYKKRQFSYKESKKQQFQVLRYFFIFVIFIVLYNLLTTFYLSVWVINNSTMESGLSQGDRLLFTSFKLDKTIPMKRGNIVIVKRGAQDKSIFFKLADRVIRFFTAQKADLFSTEESYYIKRVIALPGDEILMNNFVFRVKTSDSNFSLTEHELSQKPYNPVIPNVSNLWDDSLPFFGSMNSVILGDNECFVVSDDRSNTNDSRTWGPVPLSSITAKAVLRFWPVLKIEFL